jgi:hypothetical protein
MRAIKWVGCAAAGLRCASRCMFSERVLPLAAATSVAARAAAAAAADVAGALCRRLTPRCAAAPPRASVGQDELQSRCVRVAPRRARAHLPARCRAPRRGALLPGERAAAQVRCCAAALLRCCAALLLRCMLCSCLLPASERVAAHPKDTTRSTLCAGCLWTRTAASFASSPSCIRLRQVRRAHQSALRRLLTRAMMRRKRRLCAVRRTCAAGERARSARSPAARLCTHVWCGGRYGILRPALPERGGGDAHLWRTARQRP